MTSDLHGVQEQCGSVLGHRRFFFSSFEYVRRRRPTFARRGELGLNTSNQPKCKVEDQQSCDAGYLLQGRNATRTTNKHAPAQCPLHCLPALCLLLGQSTHMLCTARQDVCSTGVPLLFTSASTNTTDTQLNQPCPPACHAALVPNPVSPASRLTSFHAFFSSLSVVDVHD